MNVEGILKAKGSRVVTITPRETVARAVAVLAGENIGALIVSTDGQRVEGVLSERDVVHGLARDGAALLDRTVESVMTRNIYTSAPGDAVDRLMSQMTDRRIRHLPVVVDGRLRGIVSIGDVVKSRLDEIERETEALREYIVKV
jgi:CBS domain-containing protein